MSNLEKWVRAIMNEDADKLSIGSIRTLQMIKHEFEAREREIAALKEKIQILEIGIKRVDINSPF